MLSQLLEARNFASSIREFVSLLELAKDKGIIFTAYDLDIDPSDSRYIADICSIELMVGFETHSLKQQLQAIRRQKKLAYKESLNTGGRNKRVITKQYRQAYQYLQSHTYRETESKFKLSKATLYRIKQQIEGKQ